MARKNSKYKEELRELQEQNDIANYKQNQTRARSLTIGTTTGGIIEVGMRGDFSHLWYILQPVEAIEIIGQLAAAAGVEIAMRPRNDFASWRGWDTDLPETSHWLGTAPWQLSEEDRKILSAAKKNKNIAETTVKELESGEELEQESED